MPTYEYACQSCGAHVEVFQRFSEEALTECGVCGGPLRKVFHPAGILFKGSGFYATDSRSARAKGASKPAGDGAAASKGTGEGAAASKGTSEAGSSGSGSPGTGTDKAKPSDTKERSA